jgi:hypothetical protein
MQEFIKDAILANEFPDLSLIRLVELTIHSIQNERPLFPCLLDEPAFYRKHFFYWVREALEEKKMLEQIQARDPFNEE